MVAQVPDRRTGWLAGAVGIALLLAGLTLLLEPASRRPAAAVLLTLGLAAGVAVAMRRPASGRLRTPMERLNDGAFLVVVAAISLVAVRLARPWTAALPGLVGGTLIGLTLRPAPPSGSGTAPGTGLESGSGSGTGSGSRSGTGSGTGSGSGTQAEDGPGVDPRPSAPPPEPGSDPGHAGPPPPGAGPPGGGH